MKKHLLIVLFVLLVATSLLYLVPDFTYNYQSKTYTFNNFPSLVNNSYQNLKLNIPGITDSYVAVIESVNQLDNPSEWSSLVSRDQKTLEQRLEFVFGNDYEVRLDKSDNKARFTIITSDKILNTFLITSTNSVFELNTVQTVSTTANGAPDPSSQQKTKLNLSRQDFGFAETISSVSQQDGTTQYAVRLPLGFLGTDKIQLINDNLFSEISLETADNEFSGRFDYNQTGVATHLVLSGLRSEAEADYLKAFLNTSAYKLTYNEVAVDYQLTNNAKLFGLLGLVFIGLLVSMLLNRLTLNNLSVHKLLLISGLIIIYFAALKLFAIEFTLAVLLLLTLVLILTIFNTRFEYYVLVFLTLLIVRLIGFLPGFDISIPAFLLTSVFALLIWLTNFIKKIDKKYD